MVSTIEMLSEYFPVVDSPSVSLEADYEGPDSSSLVVEVPVSGTPEEVAESHGRFALAAARTLGTDRSHISVICDIR